MFVEGIEVMVKRYSFLQQLTFSQDHYTIKVDNAALGPLNGCTIDIRVAAHLGISLMVCAPLPGRLIFPPQLCVSAVVLEFLA